MFVSEGWLEYLPQFASPVEVLSFSCFYLTARAFTPPLIFSLRLSAGCWLLLGGYAESQAGGELEGSTIGPSLVHSALLAIALTWLSVALHFLVASRCQPHWHRENGARLVLFFALAAAAQTPLLLLLLFILAILLCFHLRLPRLPGRWGERRRAARTQQAGGAACHADSQVRQHCSGEQKEEDGGKGREEEEAGLTCWFPVVAQRMVASP